MKTAMLLFAVSLLLPGVSSGQDVWKGSSGVEVTGFRAVFLKDCGDARRKLLGLAETTPAEKYSWRPMEGVRSVGEVFVHVANDNYYLPGMIGIPSEQKFTEEDEKKITEKSKVIEHLRKSFEFIEAAAMKISDADLDKPADFFGNKTTYRGILFHAASHWHEHLGQSIAYARMNKIVPPWTAAEEAKQKATEGKK